MRLMDFIVEGFKEVEAKFVASGADQQTVNDTIQKYRDLVNKNQVQGSERNIDWWGKNKTFQEFNDFVELKSVVPTKTQAKRSKNVGRSITLFEDGRWLVVIPLDKDASCFHGKNSDWCTTKRDQPQFKEYFHEKNIILIYCLNKQTGGMWAIANYRNVYEPDDEDSEQIDFPVDSQGYTVDYELFDQRDNSLTPAQFHQQTGLDPFNLMTLSDAQARPREPIHQAQSEHRDKIRQTLRGIRMIVNRDPMIEKNLLAMDDPAYSLEYVKKLASREIDISNLPERILTLAASKESRTESILKYFPNAPEKIQVLSIDNQKSAIKDMINAGIMPSEDLLLKVRPTKITFNTDAIKELKDRDLITPALKKHLSTEDRGITAMQEQGIDFTPEEVEEILTTPANPKGGPSLANHFLAVKFITQNGIWPSDKALENIARSQTFYETDGKWVRNFNSAAEVKDAIIDKLLTLVEIHNDRIQDKLDSINQWQEQQDIQTQKADQIQKEIDNAPLASYRKKSDLAMYQSAASMYQKWIDEGTQTVKELSDTNKRILNVLQNHKK